MKNLCLLLWLLLTALPSLGHKASDSFIYLSPGEMRLDLALQDALRLTPLDSDDDGQLSWGEVKAGESALADVLLKDILLFRDDAACQLSVKLKGISEHSDGPYAVWEFASPCLSEWRGLQLDYQLLFERDPLHRGLFVVDDGVGGQRPGVLSPAQSRLSLSDSVSAFATAQMFFWQGMIHLVTGYDHLLFLLALLLPILGRHRASRSLWDCSREVFWVVTTFTLAHSVTLTLATLGWVQLPSRPVEIAIALSVSLAAGLAVLPLRAGVQIALALGFGLVHGFGFAGMLTGLLTETGSRALALASFNVGIEVAQIGVLVVLLPLLYPLRNVDLFRRWLQPVIAAMIAAVGLFWAASRWV